MRNNYKAKMACTGEAADENLCSFVFEFAGGCVLEERGKRAEKWLTVLSSEW